jgi:tetratricopeptide (TPR) repeat protein
MPLKRLDPLDRPYPELASLLAELGQVSEAENLIRQWDREVPVDYQAMDREGIELARGDVALARNRSRDALAFYRRGDRYGCVPCNQPRFARAWDRLGNADSAIAAYERYLGTPSPDRAATDALELGPAYIRLGELYEAKGNLSRAVQRYADLLELWRNADRSLQPIVTDIRQRVARLAQR